MSRTGVSVKASNPLTLIKGFSTETSSATVTPIGFGLGGNLVANILTAFYSLLGVSVEQRLNLDLSLLKKTASFYSLLGVSPSVHPRSSACAP
jgi:hypothetical protein